MLFRSYFFVQAALSTKKYELTAVYSRHLEKAQEFGSHYEGDIEFATDLDRKSVV